MGNGFLKSCTLISLLVINSMVMPANGGLLDRPEKSDFQSKAYQSLLTGDYAKAEIEYRSMLADDPNGDAHAGLLIALAKLNRIDEAKKLLAQAKARFPSTSNLKAAAGLLAFTDAKRLDTPAKRFLLLVSAQNMSKSAIQASPGNLIANQTSGYTNFELEEFTDSIDAFRKCVDISKTPENLVNLARVLGEVDPMCEEIEKLIAEALLQNKDYGAAHTEKASILLSRNLLVKAHNELMLVPEASQDTRWKVVRGKVLLKQNEDVAAENAWKQVILLDKTCASAYRCLADYYLSKVKYEDAASILLRGIDALPYSSTLRSRLLSITQMLHDPTLRKHIYLELHMLEPESLELRSH